ncbi:MAG: ATP-binding cassette domain-containing protein [Actinomycetota bacterium]|nr:ATP-binding cassette domain-containing protein [Actinomycetota bacterium]
MDTKTKTRDGTLEIQRHHGEPGDGDQVILARNLTKVYRGAITAVDGLDLSVGRGEVFGLLGPNGAGKTTTVGMLTTRILPTRGSVLVGGVDVVAEPARAKRLLGVVSQVNTLDRKLSVRENLYYHGRYFGMGAAQARAAADHLLEQFRLVERAEAEVEVLSGGMARRLMVARAVLHRPAVLFLDEPTAGLDPQSRLALWDLIAGLREEGHTVLLTTHFMEEADRLCDRVAIMDHGRILALDVPGTLKRSLGGDAEVRVGVSGDAEKFAADLSARLGSDNAGPARVSDSTVHLSVRSNAEGVLAAVIAVAGERRVAINDLSVSGPSLESVFINLTGKELRE